MSGIGTDAIHWIDVKPDLTMDVDALRRAIDTDRAAGHLPLLVAGTAGSVSTGAIDPLADIAAVCRESDLWFHVDGAYGAPAAALPEASADLVALGLADSVAIDPHKWLYAPLEAGCALVRDAQQLRDTFSFHPPYYPEEEETAEDAPIFYHEFGPQNSRGFRALKVWLGLRQTGRQGLVRMIRDDISLARLLHTLAGQNTELEAVTTGLSITTFRYVPPDVQPGTPDADRYLDALNREILERLQNDGEVFVSNAVVSEHYLLRACVVNFRTTAADIEALIDTVIRIGRDTHAAMAAAR
jgi:glutamate/tyrosine decarboxylase-like PLP-dependent enzyme